MVYPASVAARMLRGRYFSPSRHHLQLPLRAWAPPPSSPHLEPYLEGLEDGDTVELLAGGVWGGLTPVAIS